MTPDRPKPPIHRVEESADVPMGEWAWGEKVVLETNGLGPCSGIIMYDKHTKRGLIGHFTFPAYGDADEMLGSLSDIFGNDLSGVEVYLSGSCPLPQEISEIFGLNEDELPMHVDSRATMMQLLQNKGISQDQIHQHWVEGSTQGAYMVLDMENEPCVQIIIIDINRRNREVSRIEESL